MTANWSALHEELGLDLRPLEYKDFEDAVRQGVQERADLDWKRDPSKDALPSDVAAMANSRGGLICIGVQEENGTSAARELVPTDITDQVQRELGQAISAVVRPRIASIEFFALPNPLDESNRTGILVVKVNPSSSAPHMIEKKGDQAFRAPYRQGARTEYMTEYELARAYMARAATHASVVERRQELVEDAENRIQIGENDLWVIATAIPVDPIPKDLRCPLTADRLATLIHQAKETSVETLPRSSLRPAILDYADPSTRNIRRGPGGSMVIFSYVAGEPNMTKGAYLMFYEDGSSVLAVKSRMDIMNDRSSPNEIDKIVNGRQLNTVSIEGFAADFFSVLDEHAKSVGGGGEVKVVAGVLSLPANGRTTYLVSRWNAAFDESVARVDQTVGINRVRDVMMDYLPNLHHRNRLLAAIELSEGIESQFGAAELTLLKDSGRDG